MTTNRLRDLCAISVFRRDIVQCFLEDIKQWTHFKTACDIKATDLICGRLNINLHSDDVKEIRRLVTKFRGNFQQKYLKYKGHARLFFEEHEGWLNEDFELPSKFAAASLSSNKFKENNSNVAERKFTCPRKRKAFQELSNNSKRNRVNQLSKLQGNLSTSEILLSASKSAKSRNDPKLSLLLKKVSENPNIASELLTKLDQPELKKYTADEALSLYVEQNMTQRKYKQLRKECKNRGADLFPSYEQVYRAKLRCYPDNDLMYIDDFSARISLQGILDLTAKRLIGVQLEVLEQIFERHSCTKLELQLLASWGLDGSSSHSTYKQSSNSETHDESHLFATTFTPLRLCAINLTDIVVWNNDLPQSYRSCRPIHLQYRKETKQLILDEVTRVQAEIDSLKVLEFKFGMNRTIYVSFVLQLTMIDGKVLNVVTGTRSSQCCPLCKSKPTEFGSKTSVAKMKAQTQEEHLTHGASSLHARIRFMEGLINIGIKSSVKQWRVRSPQCKEIAAQRKKEIESEFWRRLHLRINVPKSGGCGNSNDGNTARRFFDNYKISAEILQINEELVFRFRNILMTINLQLPILPDTFGEYCIETHSLFIDCFPWYKMPATIHKILVHSREIILYSILPTGMLSEEGAEARNKHYRKDKIANCRKCCRKITMKDLLCKAIVTSDPRISAFSLSSRRNHKSRIPIPSEVLKFLKPVEPTHNGSLFDVLYSKTFESLKFHSSLYDLESPSDLIVLETEVS